MVSAAADPDPVVDRKLVDRKLSPDPKGEIIPGPYPSFFKGKHISFQSHALRTGFTNCEGNDGKPRCAADDCSNLEYCVGGRIITVSCLKQTGKKYCDINTNECTDKIDKCYNYNDYCPTENEVYPDLLECGRYVYCSNGTVYPYQCEGDTVYDCKTRSCRDDVDCDTFGRTTGCSDYFGQMVSHRNPRYVFVKSPWDLVSKVRYLLSW